MKLLDNAGLTYVYQKLKTKFVQQESGKGLSTNDYTDDEKSKVAGAEQKSNKVTSLSSSSTDTQYPSAKAVYNNLELKVDKVSGKGLSTNDYTTAEKTKLAGIEDNANNYTLPIASDTTLGGIKVGENLTIDADGKLNASGGGTWGSITGTLSDQTDLQSALNSKVGTRDEIITELNNYTPGWKDTNITSGSWDTPFYANGIWLTKSSSDGVKYSTDGKNWQNSNLTSGVSGQFNYGGGIWELFTTSGIKYSEDGITWQDSNITSGNWSRATDSGCFQNNKWVKTNCVDSAKIITSIDGKNWSYATTPSMSYCYGSFVNYANNKYVSSFYYVGHTCAVLYSSDGETWTKSALTSGTYGRPVYLNGLWELPGYGSNTSISSGYGIKYSTDGVNWKSSNCTTGEWAIRFNNGIYVASSDWTYSNGIKYSEDGMTWQDSNITSGNESTAYSNYIWVASSSGSGLYYSYDGKTWSPSNITTGNYKTPTYNNGTWIAGSSSNGIIQSVDGKVWTASNITSGNYNSPITDNGMTLTGSSANGIKYLKETNKIIKNFNLEQTPATTTKLGSIKVGNNLSVSADGTLSANTSSLDRGHTLTVGSTSITITNSAITTSSAIDVWCSIPKISYETITISNGSVTLTFEAQSTNMEVGVMIIG